MKHIYIELSKISIESLKVQKLMKFLIGNYALLPMRYSKLLPW